MSNFSYLEPRDITNQYGSQPLREAGPNEETNIVSPATAELPLANYSSAIALKMMEGRMPGGQANHNQMMHESHS